MIREGIDYGKVYDAQRFEDELSCKRDTREFGLAIHKIRMELEKLGYYLQGKVESAGLLIVVKANQNVQIAKSAEHRIFKTRRRSINLLRATAVQVLTDKEKTTHTKALERIELRLMIEIRAGKVAKFIREKAPALLDQPKRKKA
jgi:hypothetical protein